MFECGNCGGILEVTRREMGEAACPNRAEEAPSFRLLSGRNKWGQG